MLSDTGNGYAFVAGINAWSEGVVATAGHQIVRVVLRRAIKFPDELEVVGRHLREAGRPLSALCAMELRIAEPFTLAGFQAFNTSYFAELSKSGFITQAVNPIARTNVAVSGLVSGPAIHAFAYATRSAANERSFVLAGAAELRDNSLTAESIVRAGETSPDALRDKAAQVMRVVEERMRRLGVDWADATDVFLYTSHAIDGVVRDVIAQAIGPSRRHGINWYLSRPPFEGIELEVDVRGVPMQLQLET